MTREDAEKLLERTAEQLGEHFDAVQILASRPHETEKGGDHGTEIFQKGRGNWYARQGMAQQFVARDRAYEIGNEVNHPRHKED